MQVRCPNTRTKPAASSFTKRLLRHLVLLRTDPEVLTSRLAQAFAYPPEPQKYHVLTRKLSKCLKQQAGISVMCAIANQAQTSTSIRGTIITTLPSVLLAKLVQLIQLLTYPTLAQEPWGRQLWQRKRQKVTGGRLASSASTAACKMNYLATPLALRGLMHTDDIEASRRSHFYSRLVGRALAQAVRE